MKVDYEGHIYGEEHVTLCAIYKPIVGCQIFEYQITDATFRGFKHIDIGWSNLGFFT